MKFIDIVKIVYKISGLVVIGIDVIVEDFKPLVCLNPANYIIAPFDTLIYILADRQPDGNELNNLIYNYLEKENKGVVAKNKEMTKLNDCGADGKKKPGEEGSSKEEHKIYGKKRIIRKKVFIIYYQPKIFYQKKKECIDQNILHGLLQLHLLLSFKTPLILELPILVGVFVTQEVHIQYMEIGEVWDFQKEDIK